MPLYDAACLRNPSRQHVWSGTWEADSPAQAIAKSCLCTEHRAVFIQRAHKDGAVELSIEHPAHGMEHFIVEAKLIRESK